MKEFTRKETELGETALRFMFAKEWPTLDDEGRRLVVQDFLEVHTEDKVDGAEYVRRIGLGNLASYADCMKARLHTQSAPCSHEGDLIPFAAYRECRKCGALYNS